MKTITEKDKFRIVDDSYIADCKKAGKELAQVLNAYPKNYRFGTDELFSIRLSVAKSFNISIEDL